LEVLRGGADGSKLLEELAAAVERADLSYLAEEIPRAIGESLEGVERVSGIVGAMKEFSHPGGRSMSQVDLNHAIQSTITVSRNEWKYVSELVTDLDPALPPVPCLPGEIHQVILNIIVNAAHAIGGQGPTGGSGAKGTITVSSRLEGDWAEIRIADTGSGIPEEIRARIFDPFFTTKEVGKGTGQGLAIAHATVVKKHGGELSFETEMGKGTVFIVRLPLSPSEAPAEEVGA
ncbi:MAG: sensor histidine kinase, partial [Planctomycetota bacterium]